MDTSLLQSRLRRGLIGLAAASSILLTGCVNTPSQEPTPFQPASQHDGYGYSSVQLSDTEYRIMFRATQTTDASMVQEYTLLRAAQIAQQQNFTWVTIAKTDVERKDTLGQHPVKAKKGDIDAKYINAHQNSQCSMSGCEEIADPFPNNRTMTLKKEVMKDVYYSILVRMSDAASRPDPNAFSVSALLAPRPE